MAIIPRSPGASSRLPAPTGSVGGGRGGAAVGGALATAGAAISGVAADIKKRRDKEVARLQRLEDAVRSGEAVTGAAREIATLRDSAAREEDASQPGFADSLLERTQEITDRALASAQGFDVGADSRISDEASADLANIFKRMQTQTFNAGLKASRDGLEDRAVDEITVNVKSLALSARRDVAMLGRALGELDGLIGKYGGSLDTNFERDQLVGGRAAIIASGVLGEVDRGRFDAARILLDDDRFDADLTPKARDGLMTDINVAENKAATAAKADARARRVEVASAANDAIFVLDSGKTPEGFADVTEAAAEFPKIAEALAGAALDRQAMAEFTLLAPADQRGAIAGLDDKETMTKRQAVLLERMRRQHAAAVTAINADPLAYTASIGVIPDINDIDYGDPASLALRAGLARRAGEHLGIAVSPLRPGEIDGLIDNFDKLTADNATALFASLRDGFGEDGATAIADQLTPKRPAYAVALWRSLDQPLVAAEIVKGDRLIVSTPEAAPSALEREPLVEEIYGGLFTDIDGGPAAFIRAASAVYAAKKAPSGNFEFDDDLFEDALRLVAGGVMGTGGDIIGGPIEFNGQKILPPRPGMGEDALEDFLNAMPPGDLAEFGNGFPVFADGTPFTAQWFDSGFLEQEAQLRTAGDGVYRVFFPDMGQFIYTADGRLYELNLKAAVRREPVTSVTLPIGGAQ